MAGIEVKELLLFCKQVCKWCMEVQLATHKFDKELRVHSLKVAYSIPGYTRLCYKDFLSFDGKNSII